MGEQPVDRTGFRQELWEGALGVQCNEYSPASNMERTHYHDCFEIYFQIAGDRYFLSNGKFHHMEAGDLLWIPSFDLHQSFQGKDPIGVRAVVYFTEEFLREIFLEKTSEVLTLFAGALQRVRLDNFQQKKVLELLYELEQGVEGGQELYCKFVFGQLVLLLEQWAHEEVPVAQEHASINPKYDRIAKVLAYLKVHRSEKLSLEDVAKEFFVTPYYLSRTFKECTGIPFVSYLNHLKVEKAKELLCKETSITAVSMELGFETLTHFERVFKSIAGMSPTAWKKQQRISF